MFPYHCQLTIRIVVVPYIHKLGSSKLFELSGVFISELSEEICTLILLSSGILLGCHVTVCLLPNPLNCPYRC